MDNRVLRFAVLAKEAAEDEPFRSHGWNFSMGFTRLLLECDFPKEGIFTARPLLRAFTMNGPFYDYQIEWRQMNG